MARYSVNKYFGHFWQCWNIVAENDRDAWDRAEKDGKLQYQSVYWEPRDLESKGYVVNLDKEAKENPRISREQYSEWLKEAIGKGMVANPYEYEDILNIIKESEEDTT